MNNPNKLKDKKQKQKGKTMKTLIILIRTKNNQVTHELEKQIRDAVMPMADVVATLDRVLPPAVARETAEKEKTRACMYF